VGLAEISAWTA